METRVHPPTWKILLAFAAIYLIWGSTFLAIRVGVRELPPFLFAAIRFLIAGSILYGWMLARGERSPTRRQWGGVSVIAVLVFIFDYGLVFWAEQHVPSGVTAVMLAMNAAFMALAEIIILRSQKLTLRLTVALLLGICGVLVLVSRSLNLGGTPIDRTGAIALIVASISWSLASALNRKLPLPESKVMNSGAQMLAGGVLLFLTSAALGEFSRFHPADISRTAWFALAYLIVAGSITGYTAYIWLLHHESPTKVGTYSYVNPVVAVLLGYFLLGEELGLRTVLGTSFVLVSVVVITTMRSKKPPVILPVKEPVYQAEGE